MSVKVNTISFIQKAQSVHGNKYDYSLVEYVASREKIKIICKHHGIFEQKANNHLNGMKCKKCASERYSIERRKSNEQVIVDAISIHGNKYDYSLVEYNGAHLKVKIICKKHGIFYQNMNDHLMGGGCPKCRTSKGEIKIEDWLKENNIKFDSQKKFLDCKYKSTLSFDFYLPDYNICIEFDGEQHFIPIKSWGGISTLKQIQTRDKIKTEYCNQHKIQLIRINYTEKMNINKILSENILK